MFNDLAILFDEIQRNGLSIAQFSRITGIPADRLYQWQRGRGKPKAKDSELIRKWLVKVQDDGPSTFNEPVEELSKRSTIFGEKLGGPGIPVYFDFNTNTEILVTGKMKTLSAAHHLPSTLFPGCDHAERAKGDSMYPLIMNQSLVVGKTCTVKGISYGEKYIIKTRDGLDTIKFIHPGSEPGTIKLKAYNKSIPDQEVPVADVVFVCRIYWIINPT